MRNNQPETSSR